MRLCGKFPLFPVKKKNKKKMKEGKGAAKENKFWLSFVGIFYTQKYLFGIHMGTFRPGSNVYISKCTGKHGETHLILHVKFLSRFFSFTIILLFLHFSESPRYPIP